MLLILDDSPRSDELLNLTLNNLRRVAEHGLIWDCEGTNDLCHNHSDTGRTITIIINGNPF